MLSISFSEIFLIILVATVLLGKKEIPEIVEIAINFAKKARSIRNNFSQIVDQVIKESELDKINKEMTKIIIGDDGKEYISYNLDPIKPDVIYDEDEPNKISDRS